MPIRASILFSIAFLNVFTCRPTLEPVPVAVSAKDLAVMENSFLFDLNFLKDHDSSLVVLENGHSKIIVSPKYQGKVFTSTATGDSGTSFGWVHYKAFEETNAHINAYGGENRVWIGPEGGKFSVFFPKDSAMVFENWKTPTAFDTEPWNMESKDSVSISLQKNTKLINYEGTILSLSVTRKIKILDGKEIKTTLGLDSTISLQMVGYTTENMLTNDGEKAWTKNTGAPCIWILDMFPPSDKTIIVIPYKDTALRPATTDYFGEISGDRISYKYNTVFFKADGKSRGKLGIHPGSAKNIAGSWDEDKKILTITMFDVDNNAKYLNQEWNTIKPPFSGDAVNAYNDGPLASGGQLGPFYELESVSPAAFLKPHTSLTHYHSVFHFTGDENTLNTVAQKTLGVTLDQIKSALN